MTHYTIGKASIFKIYVVSDCQYPDLNFDIQILNFCSLLAELSRFESENLTSKFSKKRQKIADQFG